MTRLGEIVAKITELRNAHDAALKNKDRNTAEALLVEMEAAVKARTAELDRLDAAEAS